MEVIRIRSCKHVKRPEYVSISHFQKNTQDYKRHNFIRKTLSYYYLIQPK